MNLIRQPADSNFLFFQINEENFIILSGDSDFADPISRIKENNKNVVIFSISRKVTPELNQMNVLIFDIRKIREFICWPKEIPQNIKSKINTL